MMTKNGQVAEARRIWRTPSTRDGPLTYRIAFLAKGGLRSCLMEGCPGRLATRTAMQVHFFHRHVLDTVVIIEEGTPPHPRCT